MTYEDCSAPIVFARNCILPSKKFSPVLNGKKPILSGVFGSRMQLFDTIFDYKLQLFDTMFEYNLQLFNTIFEYKMQLLRTISDTCAQNSQARAFYKLSIDTAAHLGYNENTAVADITEDTLWTSKARKPRKI